ncbi:MAG: CocE/NonD family hydrolase [Acidimicrobiales bacterium]
MTGEHASTAATAPEASGEPGGTGSERPERRVVTLCDVQIKLRDGTVLAARLWLPDDAESKPVPAILDFLPYRQGDLMAVRDSGIYPWFAARGYGCARVDLRGTGNSTGIISDEYSEQELQDGEEVIEWLAAQRWCTGRVGMTGISWGGFNSLQLAARRPAALRAIITMCASDDRYADDVHYRGGCLLAVDMLQWAVSMLTWNALPPDPGVAGEAWRDEWVRRIEDTPALIEQWMSHQRRDGYWRHGSVCEDYAAIEIPVFAVGGWSDGYVDAVLRLLTGLPGPRMGLIGPWSHAFPNHSTPGPEIGYFAEALRWWDHWLKDVDNGADAQPMLRAYIQEYTPPAGHHETWPGRFVAEETWLPAPAPGSGPVGGPEGLPDRGPARYQLSCDPSGTGQLGPAPGDGSVISHRGQQASGLDAGSVTADGGYGDWPGDQRGEDGRSLAFTSEPLEAPVEILGVAVANLELCSDRPVANVIVRLCDVAPTGESLLVTRGLLNLTHRAGHDVVQPLEPAEPVRARVELKSIGHRFAVGHRLRLAVSSTYWPWVWPAPEEVTLDLACGPGTYLDLPVRHARAGPEQPVVFDGPEHLEPIAHEVLGSRPTSRRIVSDLISGKSTVEYDWDVGGRVRITGAAIEYDGSNVTRYSIADGDPLSAEVVTEQWASLQFGDRAGVRVDAQGRMTAGPLDFHVGLSLAASEGGEVVANRRWELSFPRDGL